MTNKTLESSTLNEIRWSFTRVFFLCIMYFINFLISLIISLSLLFGDPDILVLLALLPIAAILFLIPLYFFLLCGLFFGRLFFFGYAIYVSADYRVVCDTRGNRYIAGKHKPISYVGKPDIALFPEYDHQDGPSAMPVTLRPGTSSTWSNFRAAITGRRFILPLLFVRGRGRLVRGLQSHRP